MVNNTKEKYLAVDFDGVINPYTKGYQGKGVYEDPFPEAKKTLKRLQEEGWIIIINTCRGELEEVGHYLVKHSIPFNYINENPDSKEWNPAKEKIYANIYLDDRALNFDGNWKGIFEKVNGFKVWNKEQNLNSHDLEFLALIEELKKIKFDATKRYGSKGWNSLGEKGLFVDINRKYRRLRYYLWEENKQMTSETIEDTLFDLANYCILTIMALRKQDD